MKMVRVKGQEVRERGREREEEEKREGEGDRESSLLKLLDQEKCLLHKDNEIMGRSKKPSDSYF